MLSRIAGSSLAATQEAHAHTSIAQFGAAAASSKGGHCRVTHHGLAKDDRFRAGSPNASTPGSGSVDFWNSFAQFVQADAVTFITIIGADFQPDSGSVVGLSGGLSLTGFSDAGGHFVFSNPLAPMVGLVGGAHEEVETGPLIAYTDTSWTFGGGNVLAEPDEGGSIIPLPPGYATCEAAGLLTDLPGVAW